jgi:Dolichyl-phosphate-mannose-protein mannosyltransferase
MAAPEHTIEAVGFPSRRTENGPRPARSTRLKYAVVTALPVTLLFLLFLVNGLRGVDFGYHWDEMDWHINPARQMVSNGVLLPHSYIYPSFDKYLVIVPAIPAGIAAGIRSGGNPKSIQAAMVAEMAPPEYVLRARRVYIAVSSLAILWIYGAALALRYRRWQALITAAGLALSWDLACHARWAVTDCILVQFVALTLLMLALHHRTGKTGWLVAGAVTAGMGFGTKYTGLFLIGSVLLAGALAIPLRHNLRAQMRRAVQLGLLAVAAYLVTTPATVIDPVQFFVETKGISDYYGTSHGGFTATSGWDHIRIMFLFLAFCFFSPSRLAALAAYLVALVGGVALIRRDRRLAAVLVFCPTLFLTAFCLRYRIAVARNSLYTTPVLSLLLGYGAGEVGRWIANRWVKRGLAGALALGMLAQAIWLVRAAESIRHVDPQVEAQQALAYVARHPKDRFRVSEEVRLLGTRSGLVVPPNAVPARAEAGHVVFFAKQEGPNPWVWKVNDPWLTEAVFGPGEVDFNWYSSWQGHDRVVVMDLAKARSFGVELAR